MDFNISTDIDSAVNSFKQLLIQMQAKYILEAREWQEKAQDFQNQLELTKDKLNEALSKCQEYQSKYEAVMKENEELKKKNSMLATSMSNQGQEIHKYQTIVQSLRSVLDTESASQTTTPHLNNNIFNTSTNLKNTFYNSNNNDSYNNNLQISDNDIPSPIMSPITKTSPSSQNYKGSKNTNYSHPKYQNSSQFSQLSPSQSHFTTPTGRVNQSKSTQFIYAAKDELQQTQFEQMIGEINSYNHKEQTKEQVIANVQRILLPDHQGLWNMFLSMISGI